MKRLIASLILSILIAPALAVPWTEFAVAPSAEGQESPDVDGAKIVWQQFVDHGPDGSDWDVFLIDRGAAQPTAYNLNSYWYIGNQQGPAIHQNHVVWEDDFFGDWDIQMADVTNPALPVETAVAAYELSDQQSAAIYGDIVVWQDDWYAQDGNTEDFDIWAADVTDPDNPYPFLVALYVELEQQAPVIYSRTVVWQDNYFGNWDIFAADVVVPEEPPIEHTISDYEYDQQSPSIWGDIVAWQESAEGNWQIWAADISDPDAPREFSVVEAASHQTNPDVGDNIIVWQDFRNGKDWDIYGYNITTRREFRITDDAADQTNPAVSGNLVVWQDDRGGRWNIYAVELSGPEAARCIIRPAYDVNGDCVVNLADLAGIAASWLECGLDVPEACFN